MKKINFKNNHLNLKKLEKKLYNKISSLPVFDYHCHLEPKILADNDNLKTVFDAWIYMDHYKYRAMRAMGISEEYITGNKSDEEKCVSFLKIVPYLIGNPLYEWVYLELQTIFEIYDYITIDNANIIYRKMLLKLPELKPLVVLTKLNVKYVCTTDDILSNLEYHQKITKMGYDLKVLPSFRPDRFISFEAPNILECINTLGEKCSIKIKSIYDYLDCLKIRFDYFKQNGTIVSDHGFDEFRYVKTHVEDVRVIFDRLLLGDKLSLNDAIVLKSYALKYLARLYNENNVVMQLHIGAIRENNTLVKETIGLDQGCDSISDENFMHDLSRFFDDLVGKNQLPKVICYSLDHSKFIALASMLGNFQDGKIKGKMQFGPSWWYNDNYDGIAEQIKVFANIGVLSTAIGFLTDASSVFSYVRHDYYRRVLCKVCAEYVQKGQYVNDVNMLIKILTDISYQNAYDYFIG